MTPNPNPSPEKCGTCKGDRYVSACGHETACWECSKPALSPQTLPAPGEVERCPASPDHADIKETIEDAANDWQAKGYTSALAEVRDMAAVGRSLMEALPKGYCYMDSPAEIVSDLQNDLDEALATVAAANDEGVDDAIEAAAQIADAYSRGPHAQKWHGENIAAAIRRDAAAIRLLSQGGGK